VHKNKASPFATVFSSTALETFIDKQAAGSSRLGFGPEKKKTRDMLME
jgi:hypothetical protein